MKVFVHYKEGSETDLHKTLKLTTPKMWLDKSPTKVLDLFVESYNARLVITWKCLKTLMFGVCSVLFSLIVAILMLRFCTSWDSKPP